MKKKSNEGKQRDKQREKKTTGDHINATINKTNQFFVELSVLI